MKFLECLIFLISIYFSPMIYSQSSSKVPGNSGCAYFGSTKYYCNTSVVPIDKLPTECTSFIWIRANVNTSLHIQLANEDPASPGYVTSITEGNRPSFLIYGHDGAQATVDLLKKNKENGGVTVQTEMNNLKCFLEQFPKLSGLIIDRISAHPHTINTDDFSDNFKSYLLEMKKTFPDFGIGLALNGYYALDTYSSPNPPKWLDYKDLDCVVDFYFIDTYDLNLCTNAYRVGGDAPVYGGPGYTITQLMNQIVKLGIPKQKTYIFYNPGPSATNASADPCFSSNQRLCAASSLQGYCADNTKSFYDKGVFAKNNAAGFIVSDPDFSDDPDGTCNCGTSYPGFYAILAGFNGDSCPAPCPLLDKP